MLNHRPLVSVIIIFLNPREDFFRESIQSVFDQSYENWELLLVDDGSTPASSQIAEKNAAEFPGRVRYLEHENHSNRGMSASRNLGISRARGKYVAFLDSDDRWLQRKLEQQVKILNTFPQVALVFGPSLMWYGWTERQEDQRMDRLRDPGVELDTIINPPKLLTVLLEQKGESPGICSALMRREVIDEVGGFVESFSGMYEDQVFFGKMFLHYPVYVQSECWDLYRQHSDSACQVAQASGSYHPTESNAAEYEFLIWVESYLCQKQINDLSLLKALRWALMRYRNPRLFRFLQEKNQAIDVIRRFIFG